MENVANNNNEFKNLMQNFKRITNSVYESNKNRSSIVIIQKTVKSLESILKKMDAFLKSKNINVLEAVNKGKEVGKSAIEKINRLADNIKEKGVVNSLKDAKTSIKGKLAEVFSVENEKAPGPPDTEDERGYLAKLAAKASRSATSFLNKNLGQDESSPIAAIKGFAIGTKNKIKNSLKETPIVEDKKEALQQLDIKKRNTFDSLLRKLKGKEEETLNVKDANTITATLVRKKGREDILVKVVKGDSNLTLYVPNSVYQYIKIKAKADPSIRLVEDFDEVHEENSPKFEALDKLFKDPKKYLSDKFKDLKNKFKKKKTKKEGEEESSQDENQEDSDEKAAPTKKKGIIKRAAKKVTNAFTKIKDKLLGKKEKNVDEEPKKKSWTDKLLGRMSGRAKEVAEEKESVAKRALSSKAGKNGWLGKILSGLVTMGSFLVSGISKSLWSVGGFLLKGFGQSLLKFTPSLAGAIARFTSGAAGTLIKGGAGLAWQATKAVAMRALPYAGAALGVAARGAAAVLSGPVGWAIGVAAVVYSGWKLYKYLNRNNVDNDIYGKLTRLRLLMYGFNDTNKESYSKIFDLEMLMKDYVKYTKGKVEISRPSNDDIDKILDIFSIKKDEKDKVHILNMWYMKRFIPAFRSFMEALYSVNNAVYLDKIDSLKPLDLLDFVGRFRVNPSIYDITNIPFFSNPETLVTKNDVDTLLTSVTNDIKEKAPKEKDSKDKLSRDNKAKAQEASKAAETNKGVTPDVKPNTAAVPSKQVVPIGKDIPSPGQEGETKPKTTNNDIKALSEKATDKLNKADGALMPGDTSLEGISTKLDKSKILSLDPSVRELFTGMAKEYHSATGKDIPVNEAFRSYEDQAALYKKMPGKAAKPGNSMHELGLAIDVASETSSELDKLGLLRKYGFSTSVGGEKWHLEPIGVSLDPTRAKNDLEFRSKAIAASPGNGGDGYGFKPDGKLKTRDLDYQMSIYNSHSDSPIDLSKFAKKEDVKPSLKSPIAAVNDIAASGTGKPLTPETPKGVTEDKGINTPKTEDKKAEVSTATTTTTDPTAVVIPKTKNPIPVPETENSLKPSVTGYDSSTDIGKYANLPVEAAIRQAAKMTGMDPDTMVTFGKLESSLHPNAKAGTSSAGGVLQILDGTWKDLMKRYGPKYNLPPDASKDNPFYNALLASEYARENLSKLPDYKKAGLEESTALYLAHHYGPGGARKIINQINGAPNTPMKNVVSEKVFNANRKSLEGQTVDSYAKSIANKFNTAAVTKYANQTSTPDTTVASTAPTSSSEKTDTSSRPTLNNALYKPDKPSKSESKDTGTTNSQVANTPPSLSTVSYDNPVDVRTTPTYTEKRTEQPVQPMERNMLDTSKMENILVNQLSTLEKIAAILTSIDGKFINGGNSSPKMQEANSVPPATNKGIPNSSVDLTRRKIA